jgi:hypothetical protein
VPTQANIGDSANLEEAVMDRILDLIQATQFTPAQRKALLRRVALRLEQAEGLCCLGATAKEGNDALMYALERAGGIEKRGMPLPAPRVFCYS